MACVSMMTLSTRSASGQDPLIAPTAGSTAASSATAAAGDPALDAAPATLALSAVRPWHGKDAPLLVDVALDGHAGDAELVLLSAGGEALATATVHAGRIDVRAALPAVAGITEAAYLQGTLHGEPIGTPLVIEPLRTPRRVRTVERRDDAGSARTVVVGWDDEPLPSATEEDRAALADGLQFEPQITAGFHVEAEQDLLLSTDRGDLRIAFAHDEAPATGANMRRLAAEGFYDGLTFHRIASVDRSGRPFVVQGGDPAGTGDGTPGYAITLEESGLPFDFGVLGMARADDPHSVGCQFFIALSREGTARLDGIYSAFAYCVEGEPTIRALESVSIEDPSTQRPVIAPRILSARLVPAPPRSVGVSRLAHRVERSGAREGGTQR